MINYNSVPPLVTVLESCSGRIIMVLQMFLSGDGAVEEAALSAVQAMVATAAAGVSKVLSKIALH